MYIVSDLIVCDSAYITVEPDQTAESYTAGLRRKYIVTLNLSAVYVLLYAAVWCLIYHRDRKRKAGGYESKL